MYLIEIGWRLNYFLRAFFLCILVSIYYGEFRLILSLEPWTNNWERETMQYFHPHEIWACYLKIARLISFILVYPRIGLHIILFISNSLTKREQKNLIIYWIASWFLLWLTWYILIKTDIIGTLRDISHFDEDVEIVYVPNLNSYVNNWFYLRISCSITSQLPLIWIYQNSKRFKEMNSRSSDNNQVIQGNSWNKLKSRLIFILHFIFPAIISALLIFDDVLLDILWVILLRFLYLIILFISSVYYTYRIFPELL